MHKSLWLLLKVHSKTSIIFFNFFYVTTLILSQSSAPSDTQKNKKGMEYKGTIIVGLRNAII